MYIYCWCKILLTEHPSYCTQTFAKRKIHFHMQFRLPQNKSSQKKPSDQMLVSPDLILQYSVLLPLI